MLTQCKQMFQATCANNIISILIIFYKLSYYPNKACKFIKHCSIKLKIKIVFHFKTSGANTSFNIVEHFTNNPCIKKEGVSFVAVGRLHRLAD